MIGRLARWPRWRQRIARTPLFRRPVWIDDPRFRPRAHIRRVTLPADGGDAALKQLASEVFSRTIDRSRPLWEAALVDGLAGGAFAIVFKTHHATIDGIAGMDFIGALLTAEPAETFESAPLRRATPARLAREAAAR